MGNYSRVSIYKFDGRFIDELQTRTRRTWVRNDIGTATFWIAPDDPKYDDDLVKIGNLIMIEHDTLPVWSGELTSPHNFNEGSFEISARSAEALTKLRILPRRTNYTDTPAPFLRSIIADANNRGDMLYREGVLADLVKRKRVNGSLSTVYDSINTYLDGVGGDFWVDPYLDENDQLRFKFNYASIRGKVYQEYPELIEGQNIEAGSRPVMTIQSDPINRVIAINRGLTDGGTLIGQAEDGTAIAQDGLRETKIDSTALTQDDINREALDYLTANRNGVRIFNVIAADKGDLFSYLRPGNIMPLSLSSVGNSNGKRGISTYVKINGIAYDDLENTAPLTLEETTV